MRRSPLVRFALVVGLGAWSLELGVGLAVAEPRAPQVAGKFYPADPTELRTLITSLLEQHPAPEASAQKPRLLISPHAGYPYSGLVAARAFREVQHRRYDGVVVVGFTHRGQFDGTSVDDRESYQTPLGLVPVDLDAVAFLKTQPTLHHLEEAHTGGEHSLEVMLPFLQAALGDFELVPLLMGSQSRSDAEVLAEALAKLAARGDYLFVFSTDLSHYHPYEDAVHRDTVTVNAVLVETAEAVHGLFAHGALEACGRGPITAALFLAQRMGYPERRLLLYKNSGDTAGDKSRVVGYASIGMYPRDSLPPEDVVSREAGMAMVRAARQTLEAKLSPSSAAAPVALDQYPELSQPREMFVTLRKHGQLRGCIGRIQNDEIPMAALLPTVALDSALRDRRFSPLAPEELDAITIEVSVLSPLKPVRSAEEIAAGRDGVVLRKDGRSGVFLPQVWHETGWTRVEFLQELASQKAGLSPDAWQDAQLFTFQDQVFEEMH